MKPFFFYLAGLIFGAVIGSQIMTSHVFWVFIHQLDSYSDPDLFLSRIFSLLIGGTLGSVVGIGLCFLLTRLKVNKKPIIALLVVLTLLTVSCRIFLGAKVIPSLVASAYSKNLRYLRLSIKLHKDLNRKDLNGQTALIKASEHGNSDFVTLLIEAGADLDARDDRGWTALMAAVYGKGFRNRGYCAIAVRLISAGADVNITNFRGENALMLASSVGDTCGVKKLIQSKSDVNAKDAFGVTALMRASREANIKVVKLLINADADINSRDRNGKTALDYAGRARQVVSNEVYRSRYEIIIQILQESSQSGNI